VWTPSWVLFSGGFCFIALAAFHAVVDLLGYRRLAFPLVVLGMNSLAAYCLSHLFPAFAFNSIARLVGSDIFLTFGPAYQPFLYGLSVLGLYWLALYVLHERRIFIRL
jgi:predicted acyltransferase